MKRKSNQIVYLILMRAIFYLGVIGMVVGLVRWMKTLSIILADQYLYSIPLLGDFLRSIEIIELANIILFAILGMAFGLASILLPKMIRLQVSTILLIPIIPIIFSMTSARRYGEWLEDVKVQEKLSAPEARDITNDFLFNQVGSKGSWGFFLYTAEYPMLPKNKVEMQEMKRIDDRLKSGLIKILGEKYARLVNLFFVIQGFIIKLFYFFLSLLATILHFRDGTRAGEILKVRAAKMIEKLTQPEG